MEELLEFVPEEKREEFKAKADGYVKMTDDVVFDYVGKSQSLTDKISSKSVESALARFRENKLPGLLDEARAETEEKVRLEINPKETPAEKELREMREWKKAQIAEGKKRELEDSLAEKASELGLDPKRARKFSVYGDRAMEMLEDEAVFLEDFRKTSVEKAVGEALAGKGHKTGVTVEAPAKWADCKTKEQKLAFIKKKNKG